MSASEVSELPPVPPQLHFPSETQNDRRLSRLLALLLLVITVLAYWPTFSNGFINYDDNGYITQNRHLQPGITVANVAWAFRSTIMANWHPLTWISHMADVQFFALHPAGHHASSLLLHAINVILLFYLLRAATGFVWRSFVVAALFALHPFNVECVAWVSERKSLLCTFFLFLALFGYGWYARKPSAARYLLVAMLFALGLAAKPMLVTLPFALLLLDYWPLQRLPVPADADSRKLFFNKLAALGIEKLPLLVLSAASAFITVLAQGRANAIAASQHLPLSVRVPNAIWSYLLYLLKGAWPLRLAIFYPHPENHLAIWKPILAAIFLVAFTWLGWAQRRHRYLLAGWLWYLGCLVPVIGFVQVGRQAMADRYAYTPLLGIFVIAVWWIADNGERLRINSHILGAIAAMFLIFFGTLTWRQTGFWKNSFTLFRHAIEITPPNYIAENNLGEAYMQIGQPDQAYPYFLRVTQIKPYFGLGHYNLGVILAGKHRNPEAGEEFRAAIQYGQEMSDIAAAHHNLGIVLLEDNEPREATGEFTEALRLLPSKQSSFLARGMAEFRLNQFALAEQDFIAGANLAPDAAAAFWVGRAREAQGNIAGALEAYRRTLALQPDMAEARQRLNALLSGQIMPFAKSEN